MQRVRLALRRPHEPAAVAEAARDGLGSHHLGHKLEALGAGAEIEAEPVVLAQRHGAVQPEPGRAEIQDHAIEAPRQVDKLAADHLALDPDRDGRAHADDQPLLDRADELKVGDDQHLRIGAIHSRQVLTLPTRSLGDAQDDLVAGGGEPAEDDVEPQADRQTGVDADHAARNHSATDQHNARTSLEHRRPPHVPDRDLRSPQARNTRASSHAAARTSRPRKAPGHPAQISGGTRAPAERPRWQPGRHPGRRPPSSGGAHQIRSATAPGA